MLASCFILVGLSYYLLNLFSGMVTAPRTRVEEAEEAGELLIPWDGEVGWMETSLDGRYLALVNCASASANQLQVLDLEENGRLIWSREIRGDQAHWMGRGSTLVFEDRGDILSVDLSLNPPTVLNLTDSEDHDWDPLPSPDGSYILWMATTGGADGPEFRLMRSDGSGKRILGPGVEPAAWDPTGTRIISVSRLQDPGREREGETFLQEADLESGEWMDYALCREDARYLWWPDPGDLLFIAPYRRGEETRAVWFKVEPSGEEVKKASTEGLSGDPSRYVFYPERGGCRLAYWGDRGLEVFDYRRQVIFRYPLLEGSGSPLAWRETMGEILWRGPGGIYHLRLGRSAGLD